MRQDKSEVQCFNPQDLQAQFEQFERKAIDLWLVARLANNSNDLLVAGHELMAIPKSPFRIFHDFPEIHQLGYQAMLKNRAATFSDCRTEEGAVPPLKAHRVDPSIVLEQNRELTIPFDLITSELRKVISSKAQEFSAECLGVVQEINRKREENDNHEQDQAIAEEYEKKYETLIKFLQDHDNNLTTFDTKKVIQRFEMIYSDMEELIQKLDEDESASCGFRCGAYFWRHLVGNLCSKVDFHSVMKVLSSDTVNRWYDFEMKYIEMTLKKESYSTREILDDIEMHEDEISEIFEKYKNGIPNRGQLNDVLDKLSDLISKLREEASYLSLVYESSMDEASISQEDIDHVSYLHKFSYSLYFFIAAFNNRYQDEPSVESDKFFTQHDERFKYFVRISCWLRQFKKKVGDAGFLQCHSIFVSKLDQLIDLSDKKLESLDQMRQEVLVRWLKTLKLYYFSYESSVKKAKSQIQSLLNPSWVEREEGETSMDVFSVMMHQMTQYLNIIDQIHQSVDLTGTRTLDAMISKFDEAKRWFLKEKEGLIKLFIDVVSAWLRKIDEASQVEVKTSAELMKAYYLLILFQKNKNELSARLKGIPTEEYPEVGSLIHELENYPIEKIKNALEKIKKLPIFKEVVTNLINRFRSSKNTLRNLPSVFTLLSQYFQCCRDGKFNDFSRDLITAVSNINEILLANEIALMDVYELFDLGSDQSFSKKCSNLCSATEKVNAGLRNILSLYEEFQNLHYAEVEFSEDVLSKIGTVEEYIDTIAARYSTVSESYAMVFAAVKGDENQQMNEKIEGEELNKLGEIKDVCKTVIDEHGQILSGEGKVAEAIASFEEDVQMLCNHAFQLSVDYFKELSGQSSSLARILDQRLYFEDSDKLKP
jgi:hypothetical protein